MIPAHFISLGFGGKGSICDLEIEREMRSKSLRKICSSEFSMPHYQTVRLPFKLFWILELVSEFVFPNCSKFRNESNGIIVRAVGFFSSDKL